MRAVWIMFFLMVSIAYGQDIHFSQFGKSPLNLNSAYSGFFDGDYRFTGIHRNQWKSVTVPFKTFSGSFDMKHGLRSREDSWIGAGLVLNSDKAGDSEFGITQAGLSLTYVTAIGSSGEHFSSFGIQPLFTQQSLNYTKLTFDNQFNGDVFDPGIPFAEIFSNDRFIYFDLAAGLTYLYKPSDHFYIGGGISIHHLLKPSYSFYGNSDAKLPVKTSVDLRSSIGITEKMFLLPSVLFSSQDKFRETVPGVNLKFIMNEKPGKKINLYAGLYARTGDALIPMAGLDYNELNLGISYDVNTSDLKRASNNRGGYEIALTYIITKVKPVGIKPPCPVY
ncbi:MAG: PorP/SprF family type IX secretion system membrane protein [Bacteroidia bacterium]|nr:PorP/SprF family type IX secretion system membrane protein [Bacteroidia bacterium]